MSCIGTDNQTKLPRKDSSGDSKEGDDSKGDKDGKSEEGDEDEEVGVAPLTGMLNEVEKWRAALSHTIDSSDTLVTAQVSSPYVLYTTTFVK